MPKLKVKTSVLLLFFSQFNSTLLYVHEFAVFQWYFLFTKGSDKQQSKWTLDSTIGYIFVMSSKSMYIGYILVCMLTTFILAQIKHT